MTEKVTVTKEVADALSECNRRAISLEYAIRTHIKDDFSYAFNALKTLSIEDLAKALIIGYEVEKSPEEKVRKYYESYGWSPSAIERKGGVIDTLNLLGIKIEGVNA